MKKKLPNMSLEVLRTEKQQLQEAKLIEENSPLVMHPGRISQATIHSFKKVSKSAE